MPTFRKGHHTRINVDRAVAGNESSNLTPSLTKATPAGDARKLRGIPAIGRNVAGHIPGTSPHQHR